MKGTMLHLKEMQCLMVVEDNEVKRLDESERSMMRCFCNTTLRDCPKSEVLTYN